MLVGISEAIRLLLTKKINSLTRPTRPGREATRSFSAARWCCLSYFVFSKFLSSRASLVGLLGETHRRVLSTNKKTAEIPEALPTKQEEEFQITSDSGDKADKAEKADKDRFINLKKNKEAKDKSFNEWLAGLIDGDGCFQVSNKGYASLEIIMETRDKHCLYLIKQKFGGSVKLKSDVNYARYRLHHKKGLLSLIESVNGLIRNPTRLIQLGKICDLYNFKIEYAEPLTFDNGWLSGFFDSDGSVYFNLKSDQLFISASQKNKFLLDPLVDVYGGKVYLAGVKTGAFKWVLYRKNEIPVMLKYFTLHPSRSAKGKRILLIDKYHELKALKAHKAKPDSLLGKAWSDFVTKWESYQ